MKNQSIAAITNNKPNEDQFGFAMIRPDGIRQSLDTIVIERMESDGLHIAKRKLFIMGEVEVNSIYGHLKEENFYPDLQKSLIGQRALSMLVYGDSQVTSRLINLKGSVLDTCGSIRGDYSLAHFLAGDLKEAYLQKKLKINDITDNEFRQRLQREDRLHTDDNIESARQSIRAIFTQFELDEAARRYPQLKDFLS